MIAKPDMAMLLVPGKLATAEVDTFEVSEKEAEFTRLRAVVTRGRVVPVAAGKYARLHVHGQLMMTDTGMEWDTNRVFVHRATGRVLVGGLGLGMVLRAILAKPEVATVTVVEKNADVITLIAPQAREWPGGEKLTVVHADVLTWKPPQDALWETIYMDIWPSVCGDFVPEITKLRRRFGRRVNRGAAGAWFGVWNERAMKEGAR